MDNLKAFGLQDFPQGLGIGAVALASGDDCRNLGVVLKRGVNPLDPGAEGAREARGFGLADLSQGVGCSNK